MYIRWTNPGVECSDLDRSQQLVASEIRKEADGAKCSRTQVRERKHSGATLKRKQMKGVAHRSDL